MNWNSSVSHFTLASAMAASGWSAWWSNWCHGGTHVCTSKYAAVVPKRRWIAGEFCLA